MAQKRRDRNEADDMTSKEKKKLKMSVARTIATQEGPSQSTRSIPTNSAILKYCITLKEASLQDFRYGRNAQRHRYREICGSG